MSTEYLTREDLDKLAVEVVALRPDLAGHSEHQIKAALDMAEDVMADRVAPEDREYFVRRIWLVVFPPSTAH